MPAGMLPVWFWFISATVSGLQELRAVAAAPLQQHLEEVR